jgi:polar amino acid transport system substrate-binding protein
MIQTLRSAFLLTLVGIATLIPAGQVMAGDAMTRILDRGTLIVGTSATMPPMTFKGADGEVTGLDIDLARLIASVMGVKLEVRVLPFDELVPAVKQGDVDLALSNLTITPKRNLDVAFVGPYLTSGKCMLTKDEALAKPEEGSDLGARAPRIAVMSGTTSEDFARELMPEATLVPIDDYQAAAGMVRDDEADALLTDYPICLALLKANPQAGFVSVLSRLTYEPIGIALPADDAHLQNFVENVLVRLEQTKTLEQVGERWLGKVRLQR